MNEVNKFIPMEGNSTATFGGVETTTTTTTEETINSTASSAFKVCGSSTNLPAKPSFWAKLKGFFSTEFKVELTPYQQKVEDEINDVFHKEITWKSFKDFLFQEIKIVW